MWQDFRTVTKVATISLHGNTYSVDPALVTRKVELLYDPFDLSRIEVRWQGKPMGTATPQVIGRHTHPIVPAATPAPITATGIDYLRLVEAAYQRDLTAGINYAALVPTDSPQPDHHDGQATP